MRCWTRCSIVYQKEGLNGKKTWPFRYPSISQYFPISRALLVTQNKMVYLRIFVGIFRKWRHTRPQPDYSQQVRIHAGECQIQPQSRSSLINRHFPGKLAENNKIKLKECFFPVSTVTSQLGARAWVCFRKLFGNEWFCQLWTQIHRKVRWFFHWNSGIVLNLLHAIRWRKVLLALPFFLKSSVGATAVVSYRGPRLGHLRAPVHRLPWCAQQKEVTTTWYSCSCCVDPLSTSRNNTILPVCT